MSEADGQEQEAAMGRAMGAVRRDVEAAVHIPPYASVLRRHRQRRRRHVGAGGIALAALVAAGVTLAPGVTTHHGGGGVQPASHVQVSVAPVTGRGALTVQDVSFADGEQGVVLGHRCTSSCHDVVLTSTDGGRHYGPEVTVPGSHRYVAALGGGRQVVYGPDLATSADGGQRWTALAVPAPVADVAADGDRLWVLLVPAGGAAQLWSGPAGATSWSAFSPAGEVPASDSSARLAQPVPGTFVVVSDGAGGQPQAALGTAAGTSVTWRTEQIGVCGPGSSPSLSAVTATVWWVACRNQRSGHGGEEVALTRDAGASYTDVGPSPKVSGAVTQRVVALSDGTAYLAGGPSLLLTHDGGTSWSVALEQPALGDPHVPAGTGGRDVWVVAPGSATVYRSTGSGFSGLRLR